VGADDGSFASSNSRVNAPARVSAILGGIYRVLTSRAFLDAKRG